SMKEILGIIDEDLNYISSSYSREFPPNIESLKLYLRQVKQGKAKDRPCRGFRCSKTCMLTELLPKLFKANLKDPEVQAEIDYMRRHDATEVEISEEYFVSARTLQRNYPRSNSTLTDSFGRKLRISK
ncbi:MAG: hypothetical protein KC478_13510, partial [Bacteriovoracaceae bacterium]|nr:hypothetical protein [Bacteriovoracaceae bacterium]